MEGETFACCVTSLASLHPSLLVKWPATEIKTRRGGHGNLAERALTYTTRKTFNIRFE